ncbi:MAG: hypothetical protein ACFWTI_05145 [Lactobacillus helveticus]|jgi:aminoglycoside phosphotransferase family enzyme
MTDKMARSVNEKYPDFTSATLRRQVYARFSTLNQTLNVKNNPEVSSIRKSLISYINKNKKAILSNNNTPTRDRLAYMSLSLGFGFYKFSWLVYLKLKKRKLQ